MRSLLKTKERRQLEIIEYLLDANGWTTVSDLADIIDSSPRIIKADIAEIRTSQPQLLIEVGYLGLRIRMNNPTGIQSVYSKILSENIIYQLLEEVFFDETLNVADLAEKFFVSSSTIYRSIGQINDFFENKYNCSFVANPCRFVGDERNIRLFYRTYFSEKDTLLGWPFRDLDEEAINQTFDKILSLVSSDMALDFAYYEDIKRVVIVNKTRYSHGHLVDTQDEESDLFNAFLQIYKYVIQPLGITKSIDISRESFYQIFGPYIRKDAAKNFKQLNKFKKKSDNKGKALQFLEKTLTDFSINWNIPIEIDEVLFGIHNTAINGMELLDTDFILFDRNKFFVNKFKDYIPHFYQPIKEMLTEFCEILQVSSEDKIINYLFFTLITYWENLIKDYIKQNLRVSIIIFSDQHFLHSKMIQHLLELELPQDCSIEIFKETKLSDDIINNLQHDIIISNFEFPASVVDKEIIVIHDFPTSIDIKSIKDVIRKIRAQKSSFIR